MKPFKRHTLEQLVLKLTCYDGATPVRNRQSLSGVSDLRCNIYREADMVAVVSNDHAGCTIDETSSVNAGDITYSRAADGLLTPDNYLVEFLATIGGVVTSLVEEEYVTLIIT